MKNETLKKLIKEEIKNILKENPEQGSLSLSTTSTQPEKISGADFNTALFDFNKKLRANKSGLNTVELANLLDVFDLMVEFARTYSLTQNIENRIRKIIDASGKIQGKIDNPEMN